MTDAPLHRFAQQMARAVDHGVVSPRAARAVIAQAAVDAVGRGDLVARNTRTRNRKTLATAMQAVRGEKQAA